jgi:CHAT domain-containing protein
MPLRGVLLLLMLTGTLRADELDEQLKLGTKLQQEGKFNLAITTLQNAEELALRSKRFDKLAAIKNALGVAQTWSRRPESARASLLEAMHHAKAFNDLRLEAGVRNNLGNLHAAWAEVLSEQARQDAYALALNHYTASANLARRIPDPLLAARATVNAAFSAARGGQTDRAKDLGDIAVDVLPNVPDSLDKAHLLITLGQSAELLIPRSVIVGDKQKLQRRAFNACEQAREIALKFNDPLVGSYAVGYQGRLYESAMRYDEALTLTRRAVRLAQEARSPDSLYVWQWQTGRIFREQGKLDEAVTAYTAARDTLQGVRSDQALGFGNRGFGTSFRSEVGPLYYELADLLLARADAAADEATVQQYLSDARNTVERLRVGEFESYMQDPCINQLQASRVDLTKELGRIQRGNPAVVYLIPLADRVEILLTTRQGMRRIKSEGVGSDQLTKQTREFRRRLETRATHRYFASAKQLYQWLIKPIEPTLQAEKVDTLVFVPDGALRTVPMAALHDGSDFLIARYAVAVSPGLSLSLSESDPQDVSRSAARILASGLSQSKEGFAPLPNVATELASIQQIYTAGATKLLDEDFQLPTFTQELQPTAAREYSIVHIASHGVFASDIADTFILTFDDRMTLNDLQALLQPTANRRPIDLLTLSACQTSAGDDQAALERASLGLGGLAVKAGARSAMASLWCAHDQATGELIRAFYEQLRDHPHAGKAQALRQAQLQLLRGEPFRHPIYWAPFLMIGDWL